MSGQPFPRLTQNHLVVIAVVLLLIVIFRSNYTGLSVPATTAPKWNTRTHDVTKNGNIFLALYLLDTKRDPFPLIASAADIKAKPAKYYGKYLELSGKVQSQQKDNIKNSVLKLMTGANVSELLIIGSDGTTLIRCLLINNSSNFSGGSQVTVCGYTPGLRYFQNSAGMVDAEVILIGHLQ